MRSFIFMNQTNTFEKLLERVEVTKKKKKKNSVAHAGYDLRQKKSPGKLKYHFWFFFLLWPLWITLTPPVNIRSHNKLD